MADISSYDDLMVWKLSSEYSFQEAILLMKGIAPEGENSYLLSNKYTADWPKGTLPLLRFIKTAVGNGALKGKIIPEYDGYDNLIEGSADVGCSMVDGDSLANLLRNKGVKDCFFNTEIDSTVNYLNKSHENYAPKLAAAVHAWLAVTNEPKYQKLGTPKKNAEKWLSDNAERLGLVYAGNINNKAIAEIATIVNWKPLGGASKTPSSSESIAQDEDEEKITIKKADLPTPKKVVAESAFDDEIPF